MKRIFAVKTISLNPFQEDCHSQHKFFTVPKHLSNSLQLAKQPPAPETKKIISRQLRVKTAIEDPFGTLIPTEKRLHDKTATNRSRVTSYKKQILVESYRSTRPSTASIPSRNVVHFGGETEGKNGQMLKNGSFEQEKGTDSHLRADVMSRIQNKLNFIKKMTPESEVPDSKSVFTSINLFKFNKFYQHCFKKVSKNIHLHEQNKKSKKDPNYRRLRLQNDIFTREIDELRKSLIHRKEREENRQSLGIIGNPKEISMGVIARLDPQGARIRYEKATSSIPPTASTKEKYNMDIKGWDMQSELNSF